MKEVNVTINDENMSLLQRMELFRDIGPKDILRLFKDKKLLRLRRYANGEEIIREGSFDSWTFFLINGKVDIIKKGQHVAAFRRLGDMFGEYGPVKGQARTAAAISEGDTLCLALDMSLLDRLPEEDQARKALLAFCNRVIDSRFMDINLNLASVQEKLNVTVSTLKNIRAENEQMKKELEDVQSQQRAYKKFIEHERLQDKFNKFAGKFVTSHAPVDDDKLNELADSTMVKDFLLEADDTSDLDYLMDELDSGFKGGGGG